MKNPCYLYVENGASFHLGVLAKNRALILQNTPIDSFDSIDGMERKPMNYRIPSLRQQIADHGRCPICGFHYVPEIPENRKLHRQIHAETVRPLLCKPDPRLESLASAGDIRVDILSPKWLHRLVYDRVRALAHEDHYSVQWEQDGIPWERDRLRPKPPHAFLLIEQGNIPVGVAAFEKGQFWTNIAPG